ncbi:MAG TPA: sigma-54 dependent transcriptional regulator [Victivallales bacterium]|nr:sigma-54 dependent transcriptional regulator [Victivallales bacterium]
MSKVLIVDDETTIIEVLRSLLVRNGHIVETAVDGEEALRKLKEGVFDLMITDVRLPGAIDGFELLRQGKELQSHMAVIVITAYADVDSAVEAIKRGAFHYIAKPFKFDELLLTIDKALNYELTLAENEILRKTISTKYHFGFIVGDSRPMLEIYRLIEKVAKTNSTVLILGESGTGKELVARAIHKASPRYQKQFVSINCAAIPANLLESELYGHVRGAFTGAHANKQGLFETASGGTLLLDEISSMPLDMQAKLLRTLQEKEIRRVGGNENIPVDIRVVAASNYDLEKAVKEGKFREDLYYRLSVIPIKIPPLRERKEDIPALVSHFLNLFEEENKKKIKIEDDAVECLKTYDWPGNVRELENLIKRVATLCENNTISVDDLPSQIPRVRTKVKEEKKVIPLDKFIEKQTLAYMKEILRQCNNDYDKAASIIGINPKELKKKIKITLKKKKEKKK